MLTRDLFVVANLLAFSARSYLWDVLGVQTTRNHVIIFVFFDQISPFNSETIRVRL